MINQNDQTLSAGSLFAERYRIESVLGTGGMGDVYLATDTLLGNDEKVALKILHREHCTDDRQIKRFLREVQLTRKVLDSGVIRTFDVGILNGRLYFTMEYVNGSCLKDVQGGKSVGLVETVNYLKGICRGLAAIHKAGVVHRDLKPANVIVLPDGTIKITDFGVARLGVSELTEDHEVVGSAPFMAPELWTGKDVSPEADLYALGALGYELLTGIHPFDGESAAEMMWKHLNAKPTSPIELNPSIPAWLDRLMMQLLEKNPTQRPRSAEAVLEKLESGIITEDTPQIENEESPPLIEEDIFIEEDSDPFSVKPAAIPQASKDANDLHALGEKYGMPPPTVERPAEKPKFEEGYAKNLYIQKRILPTIKSTGAKLATLILIYLTLSFPLTYIAQSFGMAANNGGSNSYILAMMAGVLSTFISLLTTTLPVLAIAFTRCPLLKSLVLWIKAVALVAILTLGLSVITATRLGFLSSHNNGGTSSQNTDKLFEATLSHSMAMALIMPEGTTFRIDSSSGHPFLTKQVRSDPLGIITHLLFFSIYLAGVIWLLKNQVFELERLDGISIYLGTGVLALTPSIVTKIMRLAQVSSLQDYSTRFELFLGSVPIPVSKYELVCMLISWCSVYLTLKVTELRSRSSTLVRLRG